MTNELSHSILSDLKSRIATKTKSTSAVNRSVGSGATSSGTGGARGGWTWGTHKYIRKEGNRYIYPEDLNKQATGKVGIDSTVSTPKVTKQSVKKSIESILANASMKKETKKAETKVASSSKNYSVPDSDSSKKSSKKKGTTKSSAEKKAAKLRELIEKAAAEQAIKNEAQKHVMNKNNPNFASLNDMLMQFMNDYDEAAQNNPDEDPRIIWLDIMSQKLGVSPLDWTQEKIDEAYSDFAEKRTKYREEKRKEEEELAAKKKAASAIKSSNTKKSTTSKSSTKSVNKSSSGKSKEPESSKNSSGGHAIDYGYSNRSKSSNMVANYVNKNVLSKLKAATAVAKNLANSNKKKKG